MLDIFVSYSRKDAESVRPLVERFRAAGWTVFQDKDTRTRARWRDVIENELAEAGCVVAVWTKTSVGSNWVLKEAEKARKHRKLISVRLDSTKPPPPTGRSRLPISRTGEALATPKPYESSLTRSRRRWASEMGCRWGRWLMVGRRASRWS